MSVVRILGDLVRFDFTVDDFPSQFSHPVLGAVDPLEEASFCKGIASVGDVSVVEINVDRDGSGVCEEARVNVIVAAEPVKDLIIDWGKPGYSLSHFLAEIIAHRSHLRAGLKRIFAVFRIYRLRKSAKQLSQCSVLTDVCHKLGVTCGLPGYKIGLDACLQQTPSVARTSMNYNGTSRLKVGAIRGTDAVEAPAPSQLGTLAGASASETAANHARTASTKPNDGGGQHVRV